MSWRRWRALKPDALGESGQGRGASSRKAEGGPVRTRLLDGYAWKLLRPPEFRTFYIFILQKDGTPGKPWLPKSRKLTCGEPPGLAPWHIGLSSDHEP